MRTSIPYFATGTWATPAKGRRLQSWMTSKQQIEVERETRNIPNSNLEGVGVRLIGAYNNTLGKQINKLYPILKDDTIENQQAEK